MDIQTITIDRNDARQAVADYRRALLTDKHEQLRREDESILRGYRAIVRGHPIIALNDVIRAGGEDSHFRPKLAIARADERRVEVRRDRLGRVRFGGDLTFHPPRSVVDLPSGTLPTITGARWRRDVDQWASEVSASAIVPTIPPALRPPADLKRYWILFEAEWKNVPPKDPALLRALGGGLYAVLATWDLTELERVVLGMTRGRA